MPTIHHDTYPAIDPYKADMTGKVVLVTGASKGIGKAIAVAFAQAGASGIVLLARSDLGTSKAACEAAQRPGHTLKVLAVAADCTKTADVAAAAEQVKQHFGRLDVLVNNAGYLEAHGAMYDGDPEEWWRPWTVNVRGTHEVTRAFLPLLLECAGERTIVNMTSTGAHAVDPGFAAYKVRRVPASPFVECRRYEPETDLDPAQTTKLAILRLTEFIMAEYGDAGVLAFAVHPGAVATDMASKAPAEMQHILVDTPEVAAHAVTWLVRERREWLAGRYFVCQWDVDELEAKKEEIVDGDKLKVRMVV